MSPNTSRASAPQHFRCPMHPEVYQSSPGACPRCGMDLVPEGARFPMLRHMMGMPKHMLRHPRRLAIMAAIMAIMAAMIILIMR